MTRANFRFCTPENVQDIYKNCLDFSKMYFSSIVKDLKVHDIHKEACGYWPSTDKVLKKASVQFELPKIENAIIVPYYLSDLSIGHLKAIIPKVSGGYDIMGIGPTPNGWFNLVNSKRVYDLNFANDKDFRLPIYDSLLSALSKDYGIHSNIVSDQNLKSLLSFTRRLSLIGHSDLMKKFEFIEGFDITINKTDISIGDYSNKQFCFEELLGLDMRAVIPAATNYLSNMPVYERLAFNKTFMEIFKLDLRNVAPYLFEHTLAERKAVAAVRELIAKDFQFKTYKYTDAYKMVLTLTHQESTKDFDLLLSPDTVAEFFSLFYGDLSDYCYSSIIGGLPTSYTWDEEKKIRLPRVVTYERVSKLFYIALLGLLKGKFGEN